MLKKFSQLSLRSKIASGFLFLLLTCCVCGQFLPAPDEPAAEQAAVTQVAQATSDEPEPPLATTSQATELPEPDATEAPSEEPSATASQQEAATATQEPIPTAADATTADATTTATLPDGRTGELGRVTYIVDGDTIDVELLSTGETKRVRYIGMDTPERGAFYYQEATDANAALVEGQTVILIKDVSETDRFGRLLRYIYLEDGTFVNAELVRQGYALPATFPPDVAFQDLYLELQTQARESGVGLWAQSAALVPTESAPTALPPTAAPTTPPLSAATAVPPTAAPANTAVATSPPAPTSEPTNAPAPTAAPTSPSAPSGAAVSIVTVNKSDEYVDIRNNSGGDIDLNGWVLVSEKGNQRCTLGGVIGAGQTLRIWAMSEDASQGGFNCGFGTNIWHNSDPDPAILLDAQGNLVDRR